MEADQIRNRPKLSFLHGAANTDLTHSHNARSATCAELVIQRLDQCMKQRQYIPPSKVHLLIHFFKEYHDVNRCYEDVARVLTKYSTLSPRTDVHTFPNGSSALLLHLSGTIPVNFRGATYRFPLSIWVPHAYPREPPLIYVTPTETMVVRPGQHVDPQGQVYHPYLVGWAQFWDKSSLQDFLAILSDVFAKEPPVISRQPRQPSQSQQPVATPPPVPPLPPEMNPRSASSSIEPRPPPPPPKSPPESSGRQPPLPPLPPNVTASSSRTPSRYDSAPPLPLQAQSNTHSNQQPPQVSHPPSSQFDHHHPGATTRPPMPAAHQMMANEQRELPPYNQAQWRPEQQTRPGMGPTSMAGQWNGPHGRQVPLTQQQQQPPPDLLVDDPLALDIPTQPTVAAPPIPPNPQKDALLRQLAQTLASMRQSSRQQNESSLAGLEAQRTAMLSALSALQSESGQLTQLSNVLSSNANILHEALRKADGVIEGSKNHPKVDIDELLVAPTVVSNQLYSLVAEERALGDAIFMLGRAVERGRISPAVFAKMTRSLAREWYLKKALARKIGQGMGMVV